MKEPNWTSELRIIEAVYTGPGCRHLVLPSKLSSPNFNELAIGSVATFHMLTNKVTLEKAIMSLSATSPLRAHHRHVICV